jgi:hypothetical protein
MDSSERTVYILHVRRETWDTPIELCRCTMPEAAAGVVAVLLGAGVTSIVELRIEVRREVG